MKSITITHIFTGSILLAGLAACGDKTASAPGAAAPSLADATSNKKVAEIKKEVVAAALPKADRATSLESYVQINDGNQFMWSYLSLAKLPIDYKEIAGVISNDYRYASDEFKKNDLLTAIKPRIDAEIAKAVSQRYIKLVIDRPLEKYDFEQKGFPVDGSVWQPGSYRYYNNNPAYKLSFTNGSNFRYLKVESEADARNIETSRSKYDAMTLTVYAYIQDADISNKSVSAEIVKIILNDKKGVALASQ